MYLKFNNFMLETEFSKCNDDHCVYLWKYEDDDFFILTLYVDGIFVASSSMKKINVLKTKLAGKFFMKDLGEAK